MPYKNLRPYSDGNLPIKVSVSPEPPNGLNAGELAMNAASGVCYVGLNSGGAGVLPRATGFSEIVILGQHDYDALVAATATVSTTLYIVTPDPEE
jgi:hypothetical protein